MTSTSNVTSGLTMLNSGVSQYLHPDYLQPLPTTLDAKKSPLALLAQTCSAIGKDTSPSKPIIPPLEKSGNKDNNNDKQQTADRSAADSDSSSSSSSSSGSSKRPGSRGHKDSNRDSNNKPGFRTFPPKEIPPLVPIGNDGSSGKPTRVPSAGGEIKRETSPLTSAGVSALTVPPSSLLSPRPVSASGLPRSSSRSSNGGGKVEDLHNSHSQHNGLHHHHSVNSSSSNHHHTSSSSSSSHRQRDSPASSSSSHHRSSTSPSYSKSSHTPSSVMPSSASIHSSSSASINSSTAALKSQAPPIPCPSVSHPSMLAAGLPAHLAAAGYANPLALMGHGLDPASYHSAALAAHSSLSSYAAAAAAAQTSALKAAAAGGGSAAALSPFVTYARVRTPSGATTLVPVCRDPFCTNCQLTVQNSHLSATCQAPGCAQCAHEKSLTSLSALGALPGAGASAAASSMLLPHLPPTTASFSAAGSMSALSSLHSLYPHSALAAAAAANAAAASTHSQPGGLPPYVCNWVSGSDYCGKRFTSSEELLQHLRTHTSSLDAATTNSLAASAYAGLGAGAGGLPSALAGAYPHLGPPLSPNSLRRAAYPTSLSPVSSLLGASRYHPYKSPLSGVGAAPPPQSLPPVGPYYSPYTLYGQRLGAVVP